MNANQVNWIFLLLEHFLVLLAGTATSMIFVATKVLLRKHMFVMTKHTFCHDKSILAFVATKLFLSQQTRVCHDKNHTGGSSRQ